MPLRRPSSARADIEFAVDAREVDLDAYLFAPLPVCETTPLASLVARELLVMSVGLPCSSSGGPAVCIGVPVPFAVTLPQATSYCDGAPAPWRAMVS